MAAMVVPIGLWPSCGLYFCAFGMPKTEFTSEMICFFFLCDMVGQVYNGKNGIFWNSTIKLLVFN